MSYTNGLDDPSAFFKIITWTGDGTTPRAHTFSDTDTDMQPDLVWLKQRNTSQFHTLTDAVRGVGKHLISNNSDGEATNSNSGYVSAFGSDGFTTTNGTANDLYVNTDGATYVGWFWKAGTTASGTTTGSGTGKSYSSSYNSTSGFQITAYTGNGSAGHTIPVGLSSAPNFVICKTRASGSFIIKHKPVVRSRSFFNYN